MKTQIKRRPSISKKLFFISVLSLLITNIQAQTADTVETAEVSTSSFCRHEFSIWIAGGMSTLNYRPTFGEINRKAGGMFGLGYTGYAAKWLGIHIGAELALYNTAYRLKNLKDSYTRYGFDDLTPNWTGENEMIDYHTELRAYTEKQQLYSVNIPLMLQFQTTGDRHKFYASVGAKLGISVKSAYSGDGTLYTWYYDHKTKQEIRPDPTDYGKPYFEDLGCFYNLPYSTGKQASKFKLAGLVTAELGVKWYLNPKLALYTGAYLDYGFNNIRKQSGDRFFEFDPDQSEITSNSILTSQYAHNNGATTDFIKKVSPLSFGLKLRLGVNLCKDKSKEIEKALEEAEREAEKAEAERREKEADKRAKELNNRLKNIEDLLTKSLEKSVEKVEPKITKMAGKNNDADTIRASFDANLLFETASNNLQPRFRQMLTPLVQILEENPATTIDIIGHTDDVGSLEFNQRLSSQRAYEVADYLMSLGVKRSQIKKIAGKNYSEPTATNATPEGRAKNRRVEIWLYVEKE